MKQKRMLEIIGWLAVSTWGISSCGSDPTVQLSREQITFTRPAEEVRIVVEVKNAANLGAFQVTIAYDTAVVEKPIVNLGNFLTSTNRTPRPVEPFHEVDRATGRGLVTLGAATTGQKIDGPEGDGTLATVIFRGRVAGTTALTLDKEKALLTDTYGKRLALK